MVLQSCVSTLDVKAEPRRPALGREEDMGWETELFFRGISYRKIWLFKLVYH